MTRWSTWILQRPYVDGKLTDEWKGYLRTTDFEPVDGSTSLAEFWTTLIDKFPHVGSNGDRSQRIGKYLNECHWDVFCDQLGFTDYEKDFWESFREDVLRGMWRDESKAGFDTLAEKLCDLQMGDNGRDESYEMDDHDAKANLPIESAFRPGISRNHPIDPETPNSPLFSTDTYHGRMFHPETKARHLLNSDKTPGPLLSLLQRQETESKIAKRDLFKFRESIKAIKTGAISVSDPILGITESPIGDATMLPVLTMKDLKYPNPVATNWVGMNPTNAGFQYVQEAYASGKWFGKKPRFKLPKAYRRAGYKSLSPEGAEKASSSKGRTKVGNKDGKTTSEPPADDMDPDRSNKRPYFELTRGPESDTFRWTVPFNDEFKEQLIQGVEEIRNGGRQIVEKRLKKAFREFGLGVYPSDDEDMTDSDSFISSDSSSDSSSREDEERDLHAEQSSQTHSTIPAKRRKESSGGIDLINAKKAKLWLQSL